MKFSFNKLIILFTCLLVFFAFNFSSADDSLVSDAIAIRVLPNTNHYGIETWYRMQGFSGSPQSLIVDGYEAIRDGRTVYVAAANIAESEGVDKIFTNIYLISYNQESVSPTLDTLGQIISHWKFNRNVTNPILSKCSISNIVCLEDSDCPSGLVCGNDGADFNFQLNKCVVEETDSSMPNTKNCLTDMDCPKSFFCTSNKAKITRDVIRVGRLTDFSTYLELYRYQQGAYPTLTAGSYVQNLTFSTWPSWNNILAPALGFGSNMIDPINAFGSCGSDYNPKSCWDEELYKFYDTDLIDGIQFPTSTFVFAYNSKSDGSEYNLCATIETASSTPFAGTPINDNSFCVGAVGYGAVFTPEPISLLGYNLNGQAGLPFFGSIEINNPDGRILEWELDTSTANFLSWDEPPHLQNHLNPNKKNIVSSKAGDKDSYTISLNITNGSATTTIENKEFTINIGDEIPQIQAQDINYNFDGVTHLDYSVNLFDNNFNINALGKLTGYGLAVDYPDDYPPLTFYTANSAVSSLGHGLSHNVEKVANNQYRLDITGLLGDLDGDGTLEETADDLKLNDPSHEDIIKFTLTISDTTSNIVTKDFYVNVLNDAPIFNFTCPDEIRAGTSSMGGEAFECFINLENPEEGTEIGFSTEYFNGTNFLPYGPDIPLNLSWQATSSFLSGFITYDDHVKPGGSYKADINDYSILKVKPLATNSSGVSSESSFDLRVNSFCGDGFLNEPNGELAGGPFGDGYEECDGFDNTACEGVDNCDPNQSYDNDMSYACTTNEATNKPVQSGTCSYTGGKCGDSLLQSEYGEECDYGNNNNCCEFCGWSFNYPTSTTPVYFTTQEDSLDYLENITLAEDEIGYIAMPDVISFSTSSVLVDILTEVEKVIEPTSIVFITDVSGSMGEDGMNTVKQSLIGTTDASSTEALSGSVIRQLKDLANENNPIRVGLVAFTVSNNEIVLDIDDLLDDTHYNNVVSSIAGYSHTGGSTWTREAFEAAYNKLELEADDPYKYYILLSDGEPTLSHFPLVCTDPTSFCLTDVRGTTSYNNGRTKIYTIYFNDATSTETVLKLMCSWSTDATSGYSCESNCDADGCDGSSYSFVSSDGLSDVYDDILEDISKEPSNNFLSININGEDLDDIELTEGVPTYSDQQIFLNNVSCDPESAQCSPGYVPFTANFTSGNGVINFSNLRMKIIESCQVE